VCPRGRKQSEEFGAPKFGKSRRALSVDIDDADRETAVARFEGWRVSLTLGLNIEGKPVFTRQSISQLVELIRMSGPILQNRERQ
jgi:hypothetical protein